VIYVPNKKSEDDNPTNPEKELFGNVIFSYTDGEAVADGVILPFILKGKDTGMRITSAAYEELKEHYRAKGYADYSEDQFKKFFFAEICALIPTAVREWGRGRVLTTNYDFRVEGYDPKKARQLWYEPNENSAITCLKPEEH
jgi:hypothetical protein